MSLTPEQKQDRRRGIGGSDIAKVAGISPYGGPLEVWLDKKGLLEKEDGNPHLVRGSRLGPAIVGMYCDITGRTVTHVGDYEKTFTHPEHSICRARSDGIQHVTTRHSKPDAIVEAKAPYWTTAHQWGEPGTDEIPEYHVPQVIWEMAATGLHQSVVAALLGSDLRVYTVEYNHELFEALLECAESFWRDYVVADKEPPPDGSEAAREWLLKKYPRATHDLVEATEEQVILMFRLKKTQEDIRGFKLKEDELKNLLRGSIGEHEGIYNAHGEKIVCSNQRGKIAWKQAAVGNGVTEAQAENYRGEPTRSFRSYFKKGA